MALTAGIAGGSGLIGSILLDLLLKNENFEEVVSISRKKLEIKHAKLREVILDFDNPEDLKNAINTNVFFYCLGTTKAKSPDPFLYERIEAEYPSQFAKAASENHVEQFHFVSSLGANAGSSQVYLKLKGKAEEAIQQLKFRSVHLYRPSLLTGHRKEFRFFENLSVRLMQLLNPLLIGNFKKYRSIAAEKVANAMLKQSLKNLTGINIYESRTISNLA